MDAAHGVDRCGVEGFLGNGDEVDIADSRTKVVQGHRSE
jgi:hypothetical protein